MAVLGGENLSCSESSSTAGGVVLAISFASSVVANKEIAIRPALVL